MSLFSETKKSTAPHRRKGLVNHKNRTFIENPCDATEIPAHCCCSAKCWWLATPNLIALIGASLPPQCGIRKPLLLCSVFTGQRPFRGSPYHNTHLPLMPHPDLPVPQYPYSPSCLSSPAQWLDLFYIGRLKGSCLCTCYNCSILGFGFGEHRKRICLQLHERSHHVVQYLLIAKLTPVSEIPPW